jgi:hypothetical protein
MPAFQANRPPICMTCRYWEHPSDFPHEINNPDQIMGLCRRNPPIPADPKSRFGVWPITEADDWCGEHQGATDGIIESRRVTIGDAID